MAKKRVRGNLVECDEPMFITLTGLPANRSPFRVVRKDGIDDFKGNLSKRAKVARVDSLVSIHIDSDDEDAINKVRSNYGITEELFDMTQEGGITTFTRRGDKLEGELQTIKMSNGETVTIAKRSDGSETAVDEYTVDEPGEEAAEVAEEGDEAAEATQGDEEDTSKRTDLMIARIRFDAQEFTVEEAIGWAKDNGMGSFCVVRYDDVISLTQEGYTLPNEIDFTSVVPASGVIVDGCPVLPEVQKRADDEIEVLMLTNSNGVVPFGCWGWDANTFLEALADQEYTQKVNDAVYLLSDTLLNIMKWQWQLTPGEAKTLMQNSLDGAKWYFSNLLDSLPQATIQRSDTKKEDLNMALNKEDRTEIAGLIAEGINSALKQRDDAAAQQRADKEAADKEAARVAEEQKRADEMESLRKSNEEMRTMLENLQKRNDNSSSEQRSDDDDPELVDGEEVTDGDDKATNKQRSDEAIWSGAFNGLNAKDVDREDA
ncbi:MAG: hypothetical protein LPH21_18195 [Shewanella sp.]|nr:hypothetical protein [Shewanella sp.]